MSKEALVVGINNYQSERLPHLKSPADDAEAVAQILEKHSDFTVNRLPLGILADTKADIVNPNSEIEKNELKQALEKLFTPQGKNIPDTVLLYFSGHGIREEGAVKEGFLACSNALVTDGLISLQWLRRLLQQSPIPTQIIWLDCCHAGELLNFQEANPGNQGKTQNRCFIASSRDYQSSFTSLKSKHSVFTEILLSAFNCESLQESITNYNLVDYIDRHLQTPRQKPIYSNFGEVIEILPHRFVEDTQENFDNNITGENYYICPYKGLEYFTVDDAQYFYGREKLTDELLNHIREDNFMAVVGASGSGKSSVIRAGLLYQLQQGYKLSGSKNWQVKIIVPTDKPLESLKSAFIDDEADAITKATQKTQLDGLFQAGKEGFCNLINSLREDNQRFVLIVDQFEEIFTRCEDITIREQFIEFVLEVVKAYPDRFCLIIAIRADFLLKCLEREYSGLHQLIDAHQVSVIPMKEAELRNAIIKPAKKAHLQLEAGLADEILKDVKNSSSSLALIEDTLRELWQKRTGNFLSFSIYSQLGGITGTLNNRATKIYQDFVTQAKTKAEQKLGKKQQDAVQHIFLCLTQLGEGTEDTRRRVEKSSLYTAKFTAELLEPVLQTLAQERLIVTDRNKSCATDKESVIIDVPHKALIRNWLLLREWLTQNRERLRIIRKLEGLAEEWRKGKGDLLMGKTFKNALEFEREWQDKYPLNDRITDFLKQSKKKRNSDFFKSIGLSTIIPLVGTVLIAYFVSREIQLNADKQLISDCQAKEDCHGRREALERLVKATKNLNYYKLKGANLENANLTDAKNLTNKQIKSACNWENAYFARYFN